MFPAPKAGQYAVCAVYLQRDEEVRLTTNAFCLAEAIVDGDFVHIV